MIARIQIKVGEVRGPWLDIVKERIGKHYVVGVITAHRFPGLPVAPHATKPEMLPGVFEFTPYSQESAGGVKLIAVQSKLFAKDLKRIYRSVRRWRFQLVIDKAGVGFFEIKGVAIMRDSNITCREQFMQFFNERPIILDILSEGREVRQSADGNMTVIGPPVRKA